MRCLCQAYGDDKDWLDLPEERRGELLGQDEVLPQRGDGVAVVGEPTVVRACDNPPTVSSEVFA